MYHKMKTIRSNYHELNSYELNKVSLSCFDDDGIKNCAYGYYKIPFYWKRR